MNIALSVLINQSIKLYFLYKVWKKLYAICVNKVDKLRKIVYNINKQSIDYICNEAYENAVPGIPPSAVFLCFLHFKF